MTKRMYRQGDGLSIAIDHLPEELMLQTDSVLVRGEATGHAHQLQVGCVLQHAHGTLFLEVRTATQIAHQEHHPLHLEPGFSRVTRQREYTPEAIRTVMD